MAYEVGGYTVGLLAGGSTNGLSEAASPSAALHTLFDASISGLGLREETAGTLTITGDALRWSSHDTSASRGSGLLLPFRSISLHAVSRDPASGLPPCIYAQVGDAGDELRIFPARAGAELEPLFGAMCDAAAMCGPEEDEEDSGGEQDQMYTAGGVRARLEDLLQVPEHLANGAGGPNGRLATEDEDGDVCDAMGDCRFEDAPEG